jgi:hypothetical protein
MVDIKEIKRKARIINTNDARLSVRVSSDLLQEFNRTCKSNGHTSASVVINLMKEYINEGGRK